MSVTIHGAIPAMPLLLDESGRIDWQAQRAVVRYHLAAGSDGLAVGVHTTQFELHDDQGALRQLWELVRDEVAASGRRPVLVAGVCGDIPQATQEAGVARELGFDAALMVGRGMAEVTPATLLDRATALGEVLPLVGFYLQESVGGLHLAEDFWFSLLDNPALLAIKAAPFNRYRTRHVARAILRHDRWRDVALLTGNDDNIVADLVTPHTLDVDGQTRTIRCRGGLLGQFAVGTKRAVDLTHEALGYVDAVPTAALAEGQALTEVNAAVFDVAHDFAGCVAGVNEMLRQQGLARSARCLSDCEAVSAGQADLIAQARAAHPDLCDEDFVAAHRDAWLAD